MSKLEKKNIEDILGLHPMQEGMLYHYLTDPDSDEYFEQLTIRIAGTIELWAFDEAWRIVHQANEMLRTVFAWKKLQRPVQIVQKELVPDIYFHEFFDAPTPEAQAEQVAALKASDRAERFDLETGPMFRIRLCKLAEDSHLLILSNHHIIFDGWSNGLILKEFFYAYGELIQGKKPVLPVKQKYKAYLKWISQQDTHKAGHYWQKYLQGFSAKTPLPSLALEPETTTGVSHALDIPGDVSAETSEAEARQVIDYSFQLSSTLTAALQQCTKEQKLTLSSIFYTAWGLILQQYNGVQDVVFGTPVAGRPGELIGIEEMVGLFINTLPLRIQTAHEQTLYELLQTTNASIQERQSYEYTPLVDITRCSELAERENLFDTLVVMENYPLHQLNELDHGLFLQSYTIHEMTNFALTIRVTTFEPLEINFSYDPTHLNEKIIRKLSENYADLLTTLTHYPEKLVRDLQIFTPEEQALLMQQKIRQAETRRALLKRQLTGAHSGLPIAISASFTAEPLGEIIEWWGQEFGLPLAVQFAPYNQVFQELLAPGSLISANTGANLLLIRFEDWIRDDHSEEEVLLAKLERNFLQLLDIFSAKEKSIPYFVGLFPIARTGSAKLNDYLHALHDRWVESLDKLDNVYLVDFTQLASRYNLRAIFDPQKDLAGHLPFSDEFYAAMGVEIARKIYAWQKQPFKVIVLDCDNTLWKGVCGEDGPLGVQVTGPYLALQRFLLQKADEGMLLTLCSKNNEPDVWEVFEKNPQMLLKPEHFVSWRINWAPKSINLQELAQELNLGLDSLVFLDDSPLECSEVMTNCPEVLTLHLPEDSMQISNFLQLVWAFDRLKVTAEDQQRSQMYLEERKRRDLQKTQISLNDFLRELELKLSMGFMDESQLSRVAQLTQRTNQFNLSTIRRTEEEIIRLLNQPENKCWAIEVTDRFGDYGLVGVVITREEEAVLHLDTFLLSCRALGRGVEEAILAGIRMHCEKSGCEVVRADYYPTKKNRPFLDFLERTQWQVVRENTEYVSYQLPVAELPARVDFIECYYHDTYRQKASQVDEPDVANVHQAGDAEAGHERANGSNSEVRGDSEEQVELERISGMGNYTDICGAQQVMGVSFGKGAPVSATPANNWKVLFVNAERLLHRSHLLPLEKCTGELLCKLPVSNIAAPVARTTYVPPTNVTEERLVQIWSELLQVSEIGIDDNFFALGGHSIKATSVISRIYKEFEVEVPFSEFFANPTIRGLAQWVCGTEVQTYQAIQPAEPLEFYPLSSAQKRVFVVQQLERTTTAYNITGLLALEGELDIPRLEQAFQKLVERHESLRTSFEFREGEPVQRIHPTVEFALQQIHSIAGSLSAHSGEWIRPFDLTQPPLFRAVIQNTGERHYLLLDLHHIIADGFSLELMMQEVVALYHGKQLAPLTLQYKDFAVWQNKFLASPKMLKPEKFWLHQLAGEIPALDLPTDYPRPLVKSYSGNAFYWELSPELGHQLKELAMQHNATLFMTLLAVYNILLFRYSGQEEILIGSPVAGRQEPGLEQIIGMFVNTLVMRNPVHSTSTFANYLAEVRENALQAYENQDFPFELLVDRLNLPRDLSRHPLFDTMFVLQNANTLAVPVEGLHVRPVELNAGVAKFDLTLSAEEREGIIRFKLEYATSLFSEHTIRQMSRCLDRIIGQAVQNPDVEIGVIELLSSEEREELLYTWNLTQQTFADTGQSLGQIFEAQAAKNPENIALIAAAGGQRLTYGELNARANQLARLLRSKGVGPEAAVALVIDRSLEMMVGIIGILKSGGAYLPISPDYPAERINYILADSGAQVVLTRSGLLEYPANAVVIDLASPTTYVDDATNLEPNTGLENLAYVLYTSGSTGRPKGVMVEHGQIINTIRHLQQRYPLDSSDILLQSTVFTFDASIREILWWFFNGASCCLLPHDGEKYPELIIDTIARYGVTVAKFVPLLLNEFLNALMTLGPDKVASLRYVLCGGEALPRQTVEKYFNLFSDKNIFVNVYGPTETSLHCSEYLLEGPVNSNNTPIGRPISNMRIYVLDERQSPVPPGVVGEIYIAGPGVARGYLNKPELTQERFGPDPFYPGERMYRSGDLGRWLPDANVEFVGRVDYQVKIRGYRIELGEVESQILQHPAVREAAVVAGRHEKRGDYLAGYYVTTEVLAPEELWHFLNGKLPAYMIPAYLLQLDRLPVTTSGKVNRKALPAPEATLATQLKETPGNATEAQLAALWSEILDVAEVGVLDNFFELGGHSLKATALISRLSKVFRVEIPLRTIFQKPTIRELALEILERDVIDYAAIPAVDTQPYYPLSSAQKRLYVLQQMETGAVTYNLPGIVRLKGVQRERLAQAFDHLIHRHEALRTSFALVDGEPVQMVHAQVDFELRHLQLGAGDELEAAIREFVQPFDLSQAPLLRVALVETALEQFLFFDMHHIVSDGMSMGNLIQEIGQWYSGEALPELRIQYKDFAVWHNQLFMRDKMQLLEAYWLQQFQGEIPVLNLPLDYPRPAERNFAGERYRFSLNAELTRGVRELSLREGATLYMTLLAAYYLLLAQLTGQEDLVVGTPVAGRNHADLEPLIGMFVNTLALRSQPVGSQTFTGFLANVREMTLEAFERQDYPFQKLVERLELQRDLSRNPLFDTMFSLQNARSLAMALPGITITPYEYTSPVAKFDLTLEMVEGEECIDCIFEYTTSLLRKESVERFARYFLQIISAIVANPQVLLAEVEMLPADVRSRLLYQFNATLADFPRDKLIHELFAEQVERTPERIAALFAEPLSAYGFDDTSARRSLTYHELNMRVNQLARCIQTYGVQPDEPVGIMTYRSPEMLVGLLAIMKAGGAYLPVDPDYPAERIEFMLQDSKARVLLTQSQFGGKFNSNGQIVDLKQQAIYGEEVLTESSKQQAIQSEGAVLAESLNQQAMVHSNGEAQRCETHVTGNYIHFSGDVLLLDDLLLYQSDASDLAITNRPCDLAYVIYTSGSTGKPKGVMIEHRSLVNRLHWMQKEYPIGEGDTILQKTPFTFDVSVWELFEWALYGARVSFLTPGGEKDPAVIAAAIERDQITTMHFVPSMLTAFLEYLADGRAIAQLASLRQVFTSGEALNRRQVELFRERLQHVYGTRLRNLYGPTEATVEVTYFDCSHGEIPANIPIGRPIDNTRIYVLDKYNRLQPEGIAGELCIAGVGLARGYLNRPELSREKFVPDSFVAGERMYRTGDLARWRADGNLEYLGRIDYQVKIRGFRIELGEIEQQLLQHPAVREAVVIDREDGEGSKYLCAYLAAREEVAVSELRAYLSRYLPGYMIPSYFMQLQELPLSSNGKVDRKRLPEPTGVLNTGVEFAPPETPVECWLRDVWAGILGVERIGIYDDFFTLGGHSLKATAVVARINSRFGIRMPLGQIFLSPTIKGLAGYLQKAERTGYRAILPQEKQADYPASSAERRIYVLSQFESAGTAYNMPAVLTIKGVLDLERFRRALQLIIDRHQALRTSFVMVNGELRQQVQSRVEAVVQVLTAVPGEEEKAIAAFVQPFDLSNAPLLRVGLLNTGEQDLLLFDLHHIISDGASMEILVADLMQLYAGEDLPPIAVQYTDFAVWQQQYATSEEMSRQRRYWLEQFAGAIPMLNLPLDEPRPTVLEFAGDRVTFAINSEETTQLKHFLAERGVTMYMGLLAAFNILLARYSGQEDLIVGAPVAGRERVEIEQVIGLFVNTLALRNRPEGAKTISQFLREVKANVLPAYENQEYQFETLVDELNLQRDVSRNPLFDVLLVLQNRDLQVITTPELELAPYRFTNPIAKFDLTLEALETAGGIRFNLQYRTRLWRRETIERMGKHFQNILLAMTREPEGTIAGIAMLSPAERTEVLHTFNDTRREFPREAVVQQLFERQVERTPDRVAVMVGSDTLTYRELNAQANRLARLLRAKGVKRDEAVGVVAAKSLEMLVGVVAILKAGGAYLPVDLNYPEGRIRYMLADADVRIVLGSSEFSEKVDFAGAIINPAVAASLDEDCTNLSVINQPADLIYIIYTSGSTGEPKGVMIEHRNVCRLICNSALLDIRPEDSIVQTGSLAFDASTYEIWGALLNGAMLVLVAKDDLLSSTRFRGVLERYRISIAFLTTALFHQIVEENPDCCKGLRMLMVGGETASPRHFAEIWSREPELNFFHVYGPTESTTFATFLKLECGYEVNVPIGRPLTNTQVYILDRYQNLQPVGVYGELCIGGEGLARGYLKRPELTAEKFISHPWIPGERIYRTGDLARWLKDGTIEFAGRIDGQVKVRGFRIELGEIEYRLLQHPDIAEAVVIARSDKGDVGKYLCAYLVGTPQIEAGELRKELARTLPEYMIPAYFIYLERLPLTANGKIDRKALPAPDFAQHMNGYIAPRNQLEEQLARIWAQVLGAPQVGVEDNFFELGGHSLKAARVAALIQSECQMAVRLSDLFTHPTVTAMARLLSSGQTQVVEVIPVLPEQEYYDLSYAQQRMWIIQQLNEASGAYNIHGRITLHENVDPEVVKKVFNVLVERHESLRTRFAMADGRQVQIIEPAVECPLQMVDLSTYTAADRERMREQLQLEEAQKPFDLRSVPLSRVVLVKMAAEEYELIFVMHHIISDGSSMEILAQEFEQLYRTERSGQMVKLSPLPIRYRDFAAWQKARIADPVWNAEVKAFWIEALAGELPVLHLPADYSAAQLENRCSAAYRVVLPLAVLHKLKNLAQGQNASLFMVLLAGFNLFLARLTGQPEILLSIPAAGRENPQVQRVIGFFINTLMVRNRVELAETFMELLERVQKNSLLALQYQSYPLELVLEELGIPYPEVPVLFNMLNMGESAGQVLEDMAPAHRLEVQDVKYDLVIYLTEYANGLELNCHYLTGLFKPATIEFMLGQYLHLLTGIAENPGQPLKQYEIFGKKRSFGKKPS